jgi:hypothetical protein
LERMSKITPVKPKMLAAIISAKMAARNRSPSGP